MEPHIRLKFVRAFIKTSSQMELAFFMLW